MAKNIKIKVFIITGEVSGDNLGARFMETLKTELKDKIEFYGVGGSQMQSKGFKSIFPINDIAVMGISEVLPKLFTIIKRIKQTIAAIKQIQPDLVLTIDSPDFCFRVMEQVKKFDTKNKIKKVHLIAPSVWVYRPGRAKKISKFYDLLLCVLPFEPPYFTKHGLKTVFIGHPIFDSRKEKIIINKEQFFKKHKINKNNILLTVTPGSRISEVKRMLPIFISSLNILSQDIKNFTVCFLGLEKTEDIIKEILNKHQFNKPFVILKNAKDKQSAIVSSKLALTKSGTNTFEFVINEKPMVIGYKFNLLTTLIGKLLVKTKVANIINIIAKKEIIPECVIDNCYPELIAVKLKELLQNSEIGLKQIKESKKIIKQLGYGSAQSSTDKGVQEILKLLKV